MKKKCVTLEELGLSDENPIRVFNGHRIFVRGYNRDIQPETKIYRYMKLSALLDILFYGKMHISNRESFTDLREKNGLNTIVEKISSFQSVPSYFEKLRMRRMEKDKQRALSVCVSCWTFDRRDNGNIDESFLMWKAYSGDDVICRIGTTIGQLIKSIKKTSSDIIISDVDYDGKMKMNEYEDLVFRKSIYYEDEQEVRMVVLSSSKQGVDLSIDNKMLLNEIKISPFIPPVLGYFIIGHLKEWCRKHNNIKIEYSKVMEYVETNKNYKRTNVSRL